jgi:hypothetical protein
VSLHRGELMEKVIASWPRGPDGKVEAKDHAALGVLIAIVAFAESGVDDPAIRDLKFGLPKAPSWLIVESVDRLERKGWLEVVRNPQRHIRNRYRVTVPEKYQRGEIATPTTKE